MTEKDIISKTLEIMNEMGEGEELALLSVDTIKLNDYIKSVIAEAVSLIALNSPSRCINKKSVLISENLVADADGVCSLKVPDDFICLIALKLNVWRRACVSTFGIDSDEYRRQGNRYTRSGKSKPICVLGHDNSGLPCLFLYSVGAEESVSLDMFVYEAKYNGTIDVEKDTPLALSVCYMCASLVYTIFENIEIAKRMMDIALGFIPK